MQKYKIFVDGQEGTTGLKINDRLAGRDEIEVLKIDPDKRKDTEERRRLINQADIVFLCLPDDAAREAVALVENDSTRIIDASTAHRINPDWAYGIPELSKAHREKIRGSKRVSVPGCYASGFNMLMYPLISQGIVPADYPVNCQAVSGYSGGGKRLIGTYEDPLNSARVASPGLYALTLQHKHMPEMQVISGLEHPLIFTPMVGKYYEGMTVSVPLHTRMLEKQLGAAGLHAFFASYYAECNFVKVMPFDLSKTLDEGFLRAEGCNDTNNLEIYIFGDDERVLVTSRLDNLGKGASGAAVQNMNIMLGLDETCGLV